MDFTTKTISATGLSIGQEEALSQLIKWYNSDETEFTLYGRPGTGKTFAVNTFLNNINTNVCVTAPTHKAVRVIEKMTGRRGKTLHNLHGLRLNVNLENFDLNRLQFDALGSPTMQNYRLIVCDECGMINTALYTLNLKRAKDAGVKVLYIGDSKQLPPINERLSPTFLIKNKYELTEIMRQAKDNPLINVLDLLDKDVINNSAEFLRYLQKNRKGINAKGEGFKIITNKTEFIELAIDKFKSEEFSKNTDFVRIANWKNATVDTYNHVIRHKLLPYFSNSHNSEIEIIDINDILIGYKTITDENMATTIVNSEDYIVKSIIPETNLGFKIFNVELLTHSKKTPIDIKLVDHLDSNYIIFQEKVKSLYFRALYANGDRAKKWKEYFEFKNLYLTLSPFPIMQGAVEKTTVTKELDYGFSLTTHKLQGATINHMFIDLYDMLYYTNGRPVLNYPANPNAVETRNKLINTAFSRTSDFAYIYFPFT